MSSSIFEWENISLTLTQKGRGGIPSIRKLLSNIDGQVNVGQLLGIQGPSGCGKTSLINILTGKVPFSKTLKAEGVIKYNGKCIEEQDFDKKVVCISQDDALFAYLTVRDTLLLSATFHMPSNTKRTEIREKVDSTIRELGLVKVTDTIIGSNTRRGISGGEYKRVLIGKEMMKSPEIVFVDEPTTGLDAFQALAVMEAMKEVSNNGKIVIAVVHQPRSSIFSLFDNLLLLTEGKSVYFGPANYVLNYFEDLGYTCPPHYNPADFYLDLMSSDFRTVDLEIESRIRIDRLTLQWTYNKSRIILPKSPHRDDKAVGSQSEATVADKESEQRVVVSSSITGRRFVPSFGDFSRDQAGPAIVKPSEGTVAEPRAMLAVSKGPLAWCRDFFTLAWRAVMEILGNYSTIAIKVTTSLFFAVILSLIYHGVGFSQRNIQDRTGVLYFILVNQSFSPLVGMLNIFPAEKKIANREIISGAYNASSYYLSRVLAELPIMIITTVVYCTIIYWSIGLNRQWERFLIFLVVVVLTAFCSLSIGLCLSAASPTAVVANALGPPFLIIFILFGGFYINVSSLPVGSGWVIYLSFVYWSFQALAINEFQGETFQCASNSHLPCLITGDQVLKNLSFSNGSVTLSIAILIVLSVVFLIAGYVGLVLTRDKYCKLIPPEIPTQQPQQRTITGANYRIDSKEDFKEDYDDIPF